MGRPDIAFAVSMGFFFYQPSATVKNTNPYPSPVAFLPEKNHSSSV